jgi:large subunit ribosomal protein L19
LNRITEVENETKRSDLIDFNPGDTLKVHFRIREGKKDKVQAFQGVCIAIKGSGTNRTFTLRKISQGIGIERIFPVHSPLIEKIEIVRYGKVRRAKLYYLRDKVGKGRQVKERIVTKKEKEKAKAKKAQAKPEAAAEAVVDETVAGEKKEKKAKEEAVKPKADNKKAELVKKAKLVKEKKPAVQTPPKEAKDESESGPQSVEEG